MTITVPRVEVNAILALYELPSWPGTDDLSVVAVREEATACRSNARRVATDLEIRAFRLAADELDALADRHERR